MLHPIKEVLQERSPTARESLSNAVERMKKGRTTGCISLYLPEGEYTIVFSDGTLVTITGPLSQTLDILLERAEHGEMSVFTVEKDILGSYMGYMERKAPYTGNGMQLNNLLVDLVNKRHTGTIAVVNSAEEGLIFLANGVPETAFCSDGGRTLSGPEALEGIVKMAEATDPDITVYSVIESVDSLKGSIPVSEMKVRGLFFNVIKSEITDKMGEKAISLFNRKMGRSRYFDLFMYPLEEFSRAAETARTLLGCTDFELGELAFTGFKKSTLGRVVFFMENVDTPSGLASIAQMAWRSAVNYGERWVAEDTEGRIVFRVKNEGDTCERIRGVLMGATESIGYECTVRETECEKRGGRFCEFVVEWDPQKYE